MRGTFGGWFEIEQPSRAAPAVIAAVAAAALLSWLATLLWLIAVALGVLLTLAFGGLVVIRRYNRRDTGRFVERQAAFAEAEAKRAAAAVPAGGIHYHAHLHIEPGTGAGALIRQAIPVRDATTIEEWK